LLLPIITFLGLTGEQSFVQQNQVSQSLVEMIYFVTLTSVLLVQKIWACYPGNGLDNNGCTWGSSCVLAPVNGIGRYLCVPNYITSLEDFLPHIHHSNKFRIESNSNSLNNNVAANNFVYPVSPRPDRPVEEYGDYGYVLMSSLAYFDEAVNLRRTIAQNLPQGVSLVILANNKNAPEVLAQYSQWISPDRLIIANDTQIEESFWARDTFPFPVHMNGSISLVNAKYFRPFTSGDRVASSVGYPNYKQNFEFVGGNLLADNAGNCFTVVGPRTFGTTSADLMRYYGCRNVTELPYIYGIGDVDEVIKPLPNRLMLTNQQAYIPKLQSLGYKVVELPLVDNDSLKQRTYVNSLLVKNTVFMPKYNELSDNIAMATYQKLGYQVIPILSTEFSDEWQGSVHCQVMAYPKALPSTAILNYFKGKII
jgi:hypothetical protein